MKASVVVAVYNVESYLKQCVDSLRGQTKQDLEIILVDDGSTDSSGELCDRFAREDSRIRVVRKENGGLTSAWKAGVHASSGEYVGFVDSDDWVDADMFERLCASAQKYQPDMAICGLVYEYEDGARQRSTETSRLDREYYSRREIVSELYPKLLNNGSFFGRTIQAARVTKLYRRQVLEKNMKFCREEIVVGEDLQLTFAVLCDAESISFLPDYYPYHYRINAASLTGSYDPDYLRKITATKRQIAWIARVKDVYDFSVQIENDFLILAIMDIRSAIVRGGGGAGETIREIRRICTNKEVQKTLKAHRMPDKPLSVRIYLLLIRLRLYPVCYVLGKLFLK